MSLNVKTDDGKYTVVQDEKGQLTALRYGEEWRDCVGDGLIYTLAANLEAARERAEKAEAELNSAIQREDALRRELIGHREKAQGNYWAWQGGVDDKLESLVTHCPVLIQAKDLQEIITKRDKAEALVRSYVRQDETVGPELAESVDSVTDVIKILKDRIEKAEAACAEMREVLEWANVFVPVDYNPEEVLDILNDGNRARRTKREIKHALSTDCGKDYIRRSELDETIYVLKSVLIYDKLAGIDSVKGEISRLESLRKESK